MITLDIGRIYNLNDYDELARMFLPRGAYEFVFEQAPASEGAPAKLEKLRALYDRLSRETGRLPPWGVLTGVKPLKLYASLSEGASGGAAAGVSAGGPDENAGDENARDAAGTALARDYLVSAEKISLLRRTYLRQRAVLPPPAAGEVSLYIGIPFCPTRCAYCTFPAAVGTEKEMLRYLDALYLEIGAAGAGMRDAGLRAESVYIGGGTPTALGTGMLEDLLARVNEELPLRTDGSTEFCVEAGRPDTISYLKALVMAREGASRISINAQSMRERTLSAIGRGHLASDMTEAFENARAAGIGIINTDVIAGLPGEGTEDFKYTIDGVAGLGPENITVHTLAIKKGSRVREADPEYSYSGGGRAEKMLRLADERMAAGGLLPYYLYRQKQTVDNLENIGYAKDGLECVYNMRVMQERQTVVALGAGANSKLYFPREDRIERVFNAADTGLYIERIEEMIERKRVIFNSKG
ncbi:MAG: coproporphyrinogen dehydrogenase HemZ [Clostridiales Family XIII bacterium]|jgi:oxygen-independent coproporphyrinogen-3 oxidase|nr:coproporphyrinogen dehydrogenase HemZ [Clostridiales Family XIII bacterium]